MKISREKYDHYEHQYKPLAIIDGDAVLFRDRQSLKTCIKLLKDQKYDLFSTDDAGHIHPIKQSSAR
jgi:hypothetical protein